MLVASLWSERVSSEPRIAKTRAGVTRVGGSAQRSVLAMLADHANEAGEQCFPSIALLVDETELSRHTVMRAMASLEADGWLLTRRKERGKSKRGNEYVINKAKLEENQRHPSQGQSTSSKVQPVIESAKSSTVQPVNVHKSHGATCEGRMVLPVLEPPVKPLKKPEPLKEERKRARDFALPGWLDRRYGNTSNTIAVTFALL